MTGILESMIIAAGSAAAGTAAAVGAPTAAATIGTAATNVGLAVGGIKTATALSVGGTLLSGAASAKSYMDQKKLSSAQLAQQQKGVAFASRMNLGKTLSAIGMSGVSSESSSISSFLSAQRIAKEEGMQDIQSAQLFQSRAAKYASAAKLFKPMSPTFSLLQGLT